MPSTSSNSNECSVGLNLTLAVVLSLLALAVVYFLFKVLKSFCSSSSSSSWSSTEKQNRSLLHCVTFGLLPLPPAEESSGCSSPRVALARRLSSPVTFLCFVTTVSLNVLLSFSLHVLTCQKASPHSYPALPCLLPTSLLVGSSVHSLYISTVWLPSASYANNSLYIALCAMLGFASLAVRVWYIWRWARTQRAPPLSQNAEHRERDSSVCSPEDGRSSRFSSRHTWSENISDITVDSAIRNSKMSLFKSDLAGDVGEGMCNIFIFDFFNCLLCICMSMALAGDDDVWLIILTLGTAGGAGMIWGITRAVGGL